MSRRRSRGAEELLRWLSDHSLDVPELARRTGLTPQAIYRQLELGTPQQLAKRNPSARYALLIEAATSYAHATDAGTVAPVKARVWLQPADTHRLQQLEGTRKAASRAGREAARDLTRVHYLTLISREEERVSAAQPVTDTEWRKHEELLARLHRRLDEVNSPGYLAEGTFQKLLPPKPLPQPSYEPDSRPPAKGTPLLPFIEVDEL